MFKPVKWLAAFSTILRGASGMGNLSLKGKLIGMNAVLAMIILTS